MASAKQEPVNRRKGNFNGAKRSMADPAHAPKNALDFRPVKMGSA
jgi:hypothetical protein